MRLVVVVPIFNEEAGIPELCRRLREACEGVPDCGWRVLLVDDGSRDRSAELILRERAADPRFELLQLSRNFGHQAAISAGLAHVPADADAAIVMDGDLQDPPELIPQLVEAWRAGGQVVHAVRASRAERGLKRLGFEVFHRTFAHAARLPLTKQSGVFALMDRQAIEAMNQLPEQNRFLPGLRSWIGFDQRSVVYDRAARAHGEAQQSMRRLVRYAMDAFFSFSYQPLRVMTYFGLVVSFTGFGLAVGFILKRLLGYETAITGFTTLVTLMLFLGGVQLIAMGVLGEYLGRIYDEVKRRPLFIVKARHTGGVDDRG